MEAIEARKRTFERMISEDRMTETVEEVDPITCLKLIGKALDKLGYRSMYQLGMNVEIVQPNIVFDIASLMLYGAHATPIRLKILLDRLFSVLQHEEVLQVLHGFGWTYEDYARGYILQDPSGKVLDKWTVCTREEEQVILQQFLRFGETKSIAHEIILQDARESRKASDSTSDIKKFIERSAPTGASSQPQYSPAAAPTSRGYDPTRFPLFSPTSAPLLSPASSGTGSMPSPGSAAAAAAATGQVKTSAASQTPSKASPAAPHTESSPLSRLQGMQPFDFRKDRLSPPASQLSPNSPCPDDKTTGEVDSPANLSVSTPSKPVEPINIEPIDDKFPSREETRHEVTKFDPSGHLSASSRNKHEDSLTSTPTKPGSPAPTPGGDHPLYPSHRPTPDDLAKYPGTAELAAKFGGRSSEELMKFAARSQEELAARYAAAAREQYNAAAAAAAQQHSSAGDSEVANYTARMMAEHTPAKEDSSGALDYSVKESAQARTISSIYAEQKVRHLRKSANPMKRNYSPTPGYGGTLISPSGKKRVLCTACNKTFCDKGALKIHYSAVHLKEMHKCTVDGCNMMFSSRRSRNRHSANPNPKLHMPQNRRKLPEGAIIVDDKPEMSPRSDYPTPTRPHHMGASMPGLLTSPGQPPRDVIAPIATMPGMPDQSKHLPPGLGMPPHAGSMAALSAMMSSTSAFYLGGHNFAAFMPKPAKMPKLDDAPSSQAMPAQRPSALPLSSQVEQPLPSATLTPSRPGSPPPASTHQAETPSTPAAAGESREPKDGGSGSRRKRKSAAPTRCAQQTEELFDLSDDNDEGMSLPDSGSDIEEGMVPTTDSLKSVSSDLDSLDGDDSQNNDFDDSRRRKEESHVSKNGYGPGGGEVSFSEIRDKAIEQMNSLGVNLTTTQHHHQHGDGSLDLSAASNGDHDSELDEELEKELEQVMDKANPRRCPQCGKVFANHFLVKAHYQQSHLNLLHSCTVEGCNAAFPSKRSRDRHASNLNLHRKLLSTTSGGAEPVGAQTVPPSTQAAFTSLRDEYMSRMYGVDASAAAAQYAAYMQQMALAAGYADAEALSKMAAAASSRSSSAYEGLEKRRDGSPEPHSNDESSTSNKENDGMATSPSRPDSPQVNNTSSQDPMMKSSSPYDDPSLAVDHDRTHHPDTTSSSSSSRLAEFDPDDLPKPDPDGSVTCHICEQRFRDNLVLKEHLEKLHPKEMFYCTITGCDKIFSTRKSRNRHSQNDNLHKHLQQGIIKPPSAIHA